MVNDVKKYWHGLAPRERMLMIIAGVLVLLFLLYNMYFKSFYENLQRNQSEIHDVRQNHADILQKVAQAKALQGAGVTREDKLEVGNALGVLEQVAIQFKIKDSLNKIQPLGQDKIEVQYKDVSFDDWLRWNDNIAKRGVNTDAVNVSISQDNLVSIRQTLNIE